MQDLRTVALVHLLSKFHDEESVRSTESVASKLASNRNQASRDLCCVLAGVVLPGCIFRRRRLSCFFVAGCAMEILFELSCRCPNLLRCREPQAGEGAEVLQQTQCARSLMRTRKSWQEPCESACTNPPQANACGDDRSIADKAFPMSNQQPGSRALKNKV